jgi:hypothetical protein
MDIGDSHDMDIKLKGDGGLYIYEDAPIITYLQACELVKSQLD